MTQIAEHAVQCSYPSCNNKTRSPSGMCFQHEDKPLPGPEQSDIDRRLSVPKMQALSDMVDDNTLLPNGMREREEQTDCRLKIMHELYEEGADRVQLRMACGMGKTIVQQKTLKDINDKIIDGEERNGLYLVTAPSISLAQQLRRDYEEKHVLDDEEGEFRCRMLSVHQDSNDLKGFGSKDAVEKHNELIRRFMEEADDSDTPSVIFAVTSEDSLGKLAEQQKDGVQFDAVVFDEAHNLTRSEDNKQAGYTRVFFNEDPKSIKADKRIFASASQKGSESVAAAYSRFDDSGKDGYLDDMKKVDQGKRVNRPVGQEQSEMFGKVVGAEYTYRYAVEHGHLVPPRVSAQEVFIQTQSGRIPSRRDTFVSPDGSSVNRSRKHPETTDDQITLGEYTSLVSTAESLADPSVDNGGVPRNVLSFTNEVSEARTISDPQKWRTFVMGRAKALAPDIQSEEDANAILDNRNAYDEDYPHYVKAAMLVKTANHSRLTYSASNLPRQQREDAEKWFPKDKAYDSSDCTCGRHGGYCACHRVVANVDMFSEGIDIPSVDTVVLNRSNRTTEANVFQAVGRSSRKWAAPIVEDGVETGTFTKSEGRIIVPETYSNPVGTDEFKQTDMPLSVKNYSQINRVWRDTGNQPWRQNLEEDIMVDRNGYQMPCDDYVRVYAGYQYGKSDDDPAVRSDDDINATYHVYKTIRDKAATRYNKNAVNTKTDGFSSLSRDEQHKLTISELSASSDGRGAKTLDTIKAYYNTRPDEFPSYYQYDAAKTYHDYIEKMKTTRGPIEREENTMAVESSTKSVEVFFKRLGKRVRSR